MKTINVLVIFLHKMSINFSLILLISGSNGEFSIVAVCTSFEPISEMI